MKSTCIMLALAVLLSPAVVTSAEPKTTQEIRLLYPIPQPSKEASISIYHRPTQTMYLVKARESAGSTVEHHYLLPATVKG